MLTGYCKAFPAETPISLSKNELIFVLDGKLLLGKTEIESGMGIVASESTELGVADTARCLILRFDNSEIDAAVRSIRINDGKIFNFSASKIFEDASFCFFSKETTYDNSMLEHGIAYTFLSFIKKSEQADDYISKTEQYIEKNLHEPIKIDDIAASLSISRGYLRNVFYKEKGLSPQEYLMQRRIERAKQLLLEKRLPVSAVASAVGYTDALGFSRIFKKHTGVSPSEYRDGKQKYHDNNIIDRDIAIKEATKESKPVPTAPETKPISADAITAALAIQIEKAAAAAREELERKEEEKKSPPPFWLL